MRCSLSRSCALSYPPLPTADVFSDINKIMRCAYGADTVYQNLALEALEAWKTWNRDLSSSSGLPDGLSSSDVLYVNNGNLSISDRSDLGDFEMTSLRNLTAVGQDHTQFKIADPGDVERAIGSGFGHAVDPFGRVEKGKVYSGVLDTAGGLLYADKACLFALHKARSMGVKFLFGEAGTFAGFVNANDDDSIIKGIKTSAGQEHQARLVIIAGGGWTPTLVTEMDNLCETTGGSVVFYKIPRNSPMWHRLSPEKFPSYAWGMRDGASGGIYGFPRDPDGIFKIGYRGTK